jgi:predicted deacylase
MEISARSRRRMSDTVLDLHCGHHMCIHANAGLATYQMLSDMARVYSEMCMIMYNWSTKLAALCTRLDLQQDTLAVCSDADLQAGR